jgi:LPXTG-site transpeptidase (sortase) family protein
VPTLTNGDTIEIMDLTGTTVTYEVYDNHVVDPTDVSDTTQKTNGKREITLITCTNDSKQRVVVKATAIE